MAVLSVKDTKSFVDEFLREYLSDGMGAKTWVIQCSLVVISHLKNPLSNL
jgi:hypothetical protein